MENKETLQAKEAIGYDRQVTMFGKERADTALQFYMLGFAEGSESLPTASVSDEEIRLKSTEHNILDQFGFKEGAKWLRSKLSSELKCTCSGNTTNITPIECYPVHSKPEERKQDGK